MRTGIVAFLIGNTCLLYWPYLPDIYFILMISGLIFILTVILYKARRHFVSLASINCSLYFIILCFFTGVLYTSLYINQQLPALDLGQMEGKTITITGVIASIPYKSDKKQGFEFLVKALEKTHDSGKKQWDQSFNGKVRLSWYSTDKVIENGQKWQLDVRLKKPNGLLNPGAFDYEQWLFQNRIVATGYVRDGFYLPESGSGFTRSFLVGLRQAVANRLDTALEKHPYKGLIKALAIGVRHDIEAQQWQAFLRTGTNHLIAISGLHIGLMSSLIWFFVNALWKSSTALNLRVPAYYIASIMALLSAFIYAALAGFAIPTQRALIMLAVVFVALMLKREIAPSYVILLALFMVLLIDPLSPLAVGFWLSFTAVAVIIFALTARLKVVTGRFSQFIQLGRMQWSIFIGLMPLMMILFHQFSLLSPVANFLAVPFMSLIIVPVTLLATACLIVAEPLGLLLFKLLEWPMEGLMFTLIYFSNWSDSMYSLPETSWLNFLLACVGCLWLLMPGGWKGRWLGALLLLPAFLTEGEKIPEGQLQMTVLDVGQGLSVILRTRNHTLIYDTGDKYSEQFNMADKVIVPYMRAKGGGKIDKLIVSHSDRDHAGSYSELLNQLSVTEVISGEPEWLNRNNSQHSDIEYDHKQIHAEPCFQGQQWQWDKVHFKVLSPQWPVKSKKANNRSCVILVTTAMNQTILLTGDIEKKVEQDLLSLYPELRVDILLVPHHGSKTSSSQAFLEQLNPKIALFSYGYLNRFRHPAEKVVRRYKKLNIKLFNTSNGAIDISSNLTNNSLLVRQYRVENRRFWHRDPEHL